MLKSNLLLRKGDLCCVVGDMPFATDAHLFRTDGMYECFEPDEHIIYIGFYGHVSRTPYHVVLTKFGLMRIIDRNITHANIS
jgi:hypothetical protein